MPEKQPSTLPDIDKLINNLHDKSANLSGIRNELISILQQSISNYNFATEQPRTLEVQLSAIKTLDDLLKSEESTVTNLVKTQLLKKETETNTDVKAATVEMLKAIRVSQQNQKKSVTIPEDAMDKIEKAATALKDITEDELHINE